MCYVSDTKKSVIGMIDKKQNTQRISEKVWIYNYIKQWVRADIENGLTGERLDIYWAKASEEDTDDR